MNVKENDQNVRLRSCLVTAIAPCRATMTTNTPPKSICSTSFRHGNHHGHTFLGLNSPSAFAIFIVAWYGMILVKCCVIPRLWWQRRNEPFSHVKKSNRRNRVACYVHSVQAKGAAGGLQPPSLYPPSPAEVTCIQRYKHIYPKKLTILKAPDSQILTFQILKL